MPTEFEVSGLIPATPEDVYKAWLDSDQHEKMTGSPAKVSDQVGGEFIAWDGYIAGLNLELEPYSRILQSWRTTEFDEADPDSMLEIKFDVQHDGTLVTIRHTNLPDHGMQYQQGWIDAYFTPMKAYF